MCGMYRDSTREGGRGSLVVIVTEFGNSGVGGRNSLCMLVLMMELLTREVGLMGVGMGMEMEGDGV